MVVTGSVIDERDDSYDGKKGRVHVWCITVSENASEVNLLTNVDYNLSDEEQKLHQGKLKGKVVSVGIRELNPGFGGRLRAKGKLLSVK